MAMGDLLKLIWYAVAGLFRSRAALQTEVLALRHQLNVLRRRAPKRVTVSNIDRLVFAALYHLAPEVLDAVKILKPETIIRWHRAGFRTWWRWKSRPRGGRPRTPDEIRQLIREMSVANPLWGAPRIHGELLKVGMDVGQTTVAKYAAKRRAAAVAGLEDLCSQSRRRPSRRSTGGADDLVWAAVWTSHPAAVTPRASVAGCDSPSQCRMACPSADRGLRLGRASTLLDPRPRRASGPGAFATDRSRRGRLGNGIKIVEMTSRHNIPAIYPTGGFVRAGGLISYNADFLALSRQIGSLCVAQILRARNLPIYQYSSRLSSSWSST
jgi:hypothetical protein